MRRLILLLSFASAALAQLTYEQKSASLASFELVWSTVRDRHPDRALNGLDWDAIHDATRPRIAQAKSIEEVRAILREMLAKLNASHYAIIPGDLYKPPAPPIAEITPTEPPRPPAAPSDDAAPPLAKPALEPGKLVTFGNLPESRLTFESRPLPGGAGYIRFNEFLDPVSLMPQFEAAVKKFAKAPGIVLDLRGNRGGIGAMAMGIAGFFIDKPGQSLGDMRMSDVTLHFVVFPRAETYPGKLAILLDGGSASTTEILAQGLRDLKRARIFGSPSAGAALPSDIIRLPDGDRFQFAEAGYTSASGLILEGNGVTPDVEVPPGQAPKVSGGDPVIEAAEAWIYR